MQGTFFVKIFNKLWFSKLICQAIIKVWSTFSKVVGVGKAHKYFPLTQSDDSQTARCLRSKNCCIGRFYGRCPNPQFLKKLSKLFCFWEDNLALAKLQCPTDIPLKHNLLFLIMKSTCKFNRNLKMSREVVFNHLIYPYFI